MPRPVYFKLTQLTLPAILDAYAQAYGTVAPNYRFVYPPEFGEGYIQGFVLPSGLEAIVFKYHYLSSLYSQHVANASEKYMIWFDITSTEDEDYAFGVDNEKQTMSGQEIKIGVLFSSLHNFFNIRPKGAKGYGVCILLNKKLIDKICPPAFWKSSLEWYHELRVQQLQTVKITDAEKTIVEEIQHLALYNNNYLKLEKKLYQILELYFLRLINAYNNSVIRSGFTQQELLAAEHIEYYLNKYVHQMQPDYNELKKETGLNRPMLDKLIKRVYNCTLLEYFNKLKIQSTYADVISLNKDIKDIAYDLGYSNPSNFIAAFKKEYGTTPAHLRETMLYQ